MLHSILINFVIEITGENKDRLRFIKLPLGKVDSVVFHPQTNIYYPKNTSEVQNKNNIMKLIESSCKHYFLPFSSGTKTAAATVVVHKPFLSPEAD